MTPRFVPDLIDIEQELFELPKKVRNAYNGGLSADDLTQERLTYDKDVQTAAIETDSSDADEDEAPDRTQREQDLAAEQLARDKALEEESEQLEKEIEQEIRGSCHIFLRWDSGS